MSEQLQTADLALPYQSIPRIDQSFEMSEDSYLDLLLPTDTNRHGRLRLYNVNDRWIQALDLSKHDGWLPEGDALYDNPHGAFDNFELDEPFVVGRDHNPDNLPILNKNVISRNHFSLCVSLGSRGLILAVKDLGSHNGTEIVMNETLNLHRTELLSAV